MSRRRPGARVRFPSLADAPPAPAPVPMLGPVIFTVRFNGQDVRFDLSDLPCPRLVRPLAQALTEIGGEHNSLRTRSGFQVIMSAVRDFVAFTVAALGDRAGEVSLQDLEPEMLDAFEAKLIAEHGIASSRPPEVMAAVVRVLRGAHDHHPGTMDTAMLTRITYGMATATEYVKTPLDAYPLPLFEEIREAALRDVRVIRDRILAGEQLAETGENPEVGGWHRLANVVCHVQQHGALLPGHPEIVRHRLALGGGVRHVNAHLFLTREDVLAFVIALICHTGLEPECAKGLRADCLVSPAKGYVSLAYVKKRAGGDAAKSVRVADGGALHHPGGLVRLALRLTQRGRTLLGSDALWVGAGDDGLCEPFRKQHSHTLQVDRFLRRHGLVGRTDRGGRPLLLDLRRLRKSYKSELYHRTAGVLPDFAVGHSQETAASHYADIPAHRELHERTIENGLTEALAVALPTPIVLDEDGHRLDSSEAHLTPDEVAAAMSGQSDVWLASCRDFYNSPFARTKKTGCPVAIWGCLDCPNAVFSTRHLPSVLSFLSFCEAQREEMPEAEWTLRYGLAWQRIVHGIQPRFTPEQIRTARAIAEAAGPALSLPTQMLEQFGLNTTSRSNPAAHQLDAEPAPDRIADDAFVLPAHLTSPDVRGPRFGETVWDLRPFLRRTSCRFSVDFSGLPDEIAIRTAKEYLYSRLRRAVPGRGHSGVRATVLAPSGMVGELQTFKAVLTALRAVGAPRLRDVTREHLDAARSRWDSVETAAVYICFLRNLAGHSPFLTQDRLTVYPWPGRTAAAVAGRQRFDENRTDRIPEAIIAPLLAAAIFYVTTASKDILAGLREVEHLEAARDLLDLNRARPRSASARSSSAAPDKAAASRRSRSQS